MRDQFDELILDSVGEFDSIEPEVIGPVDTRMCVRDTRAFPFRFICNFEDARTPPALTPPRFCTGTLIGPRTVLTAGHCIIKALNSGMSPSDVRVTPGRNAAARPFGTANAAAFQLAPGFVSSTATDYGVLTLSDPIGLKCNWWTYDYFRWPGDTVGTCILQSGNLPIPGGGLPVQNSGYPKDLPAATHLGGRRDPCFNPAVNLIRSVQYSDSSNSAIRVTPRGILEYLNDTFVGHSGGPVWREQAASAHGRIMVAIHISGDSPEFPDVANRGVFIQGSVLEFIRAHAFYPPGAVPAGSAGRPTVRFGSKGAPVRELQYRLNIWIAITPAAGMAPLAVDGIFGPKTLAATRAFQKAFALLVDGIVGPQTWNRLVTPF